MKSFGPKNFQIPCTDQKVPFWQFFRKGRDGDALLVQPSRIPHRISKNLFVLGSYESLERLIGKIGEAPFFKGSIRWNNSVSRIGARWNTPKSALANCQLEPLEILWNDCTTDSALSKMKAGIRQLLLWCDFWTNLTIWVGEKTWKMLEALLWCRFHQEIWCSLCLSNVGSSHLLTQQFHSWN